MNQPYHFSNISQMAVSRTVLVRGRIPNPDGRLRPGMFLSVRVVRSDVHVLMIPEGAVVPLGSAKGLLNALFRFRRQGIFQVLLRLLVWRQQHRREFLKMA